MKIRLVFALFVLFVAIGCGKKDDAKSPSSGSDMDDALALLPGSAIAAGTVDARAFFGSQTFGSDLAKLVEKYVPIGQEAGFSASRDVDRVTFASYSYQGIDVAAVVVGRFDEAKIKQAAQTQALTKSGAPMVASQYAGHDIYTVSNVGFTLLSGTRALAGTEAGMRRILDRIRDNRVKRDLAPWMISTIETPSAAFAVTVDLATQPVPPDLMRQVPVPFLQTLKAVRVVGTFKDSAVNLAGSLTYPDEAGAQSASAGVQQAAGFTKALALIGVKVKDVKVTVEKTDVQVALGVDDQSLRTLLASLPQWLGQ